MALRAGIVLACAAGETNRAVAGTLHVSSNSACKWRERFRVRRLEGLADELRPGTLMNWQRQTLLTSSVEDRIRPVPPSNAQPSFLMPVPNISARDDEYQSTPLAWAARTNAAQMVEFLLARGAPTNLPDDEPWATPLAWAERRQHAGIVSILRRHGGER